MTTSNPIFLEIQEIRNEMLPQRVEYMPQHIVENRLSCIEINRITHSKIPIAALHSAGKKIGLLVSGNNHSIDFKFVTGDEGNSSVLSMLNSFCTDVPFSAVNVNPLEKLLENTNSLWLATGIPRKLGELFDALKTVYGCSWWILVSASPVDEQYLVEQRETLIADINKTKNYCQEENLAEHYLGLLEKYLSYFDDSLSVGMWETSIFFGSESVDISLMLKDLLVGCLGGNLLERIHVTELDLQYRKNIVNLTPIQDHISNKSTILHSPRYTTFLSSQDLSILVCFPKKELPGFKVQKIPDFSLNSNNYGSILLGEIMWNGTLTGNNLLLNELQLAKHLAIFGIPGSGKTNFIFSLLVQLSVPFLVIEPAKSEYDELLYYNIQGLTVYSVGDDSEKSSNAGRKMFKFNPFYVPENVHVVRHIGMLSTVFRISFPMYAALPYLLDKALNGIYKKHGWDLRHNKRGSTPTLGDLLKEIEEVAKSTGYSAHLSQDILGALVGRISSLLEDPKGPIFETGGDAILDLLKKPAVLEMSILKDEDKALVMGLIFGILYEIFESEGTSPILRYQIIVEEAHRLFSSVTRSGPSEDVGNAQGGVVDALCNYLSEVRAFGVGIALVDQSPTKLARDATRLTATKVAFSILDGEDRKVLQDAMGLSEEQSNFLSSLVPGNAVCTTGPGKPTMISVPYMKKEIQDGTEKLSRFSSKMRALGKGLYE